VGALPNTPTSGRAIVSRQHPPDRWAPITVLSACSSSVKFFRRTALKGCDRGLSPSTCHGLSGVTHPNFPGHGAPITLSCAVGTMQRSHLLIFPCQCASGLTMRTDLNSGAVGRPVALLPILVHRPVRLIDDAVMTFREHRLADRAPHGTAELPTPRAHHDRVEVQALGSGEHQDRHGRLRAGEHSARSRQVTPDNGETR